METIKNKKFTKAEKSWILYDWANSVYATNMMAAIFPIYYAGVAGDAGDKWWGIGVSAASLIVAVLAPFLGAFGDFRGMKKKLLIAFLILGVSFTAVTAFTGSWQDVYKRQIPLGEILVHRCDSFHHLFIIGHIGTSFRIIDSLLLLRLILILWLILGKAIEQIYRSHDQTHHYKDSHHTQQHQQQGVGYVTGMKLNIHFRSPFL